MLSMTALGGLFTGLALRNGDNLALGSLAAGIALSGYLWWRYAWRDEFVRGLNILVLITFVATAGLALYANLSYLLWWLGYPMSIGTVAAGKMQENYWLGPFTLLYAVVAWISLRFYSK